MNFVGALIFLSVLAVLPTHTFTSIHLLDASIFDKLNWHFDWHTVRQLWIDSSYLHTEPKIFLYIQLLEKIEQIGLIEKNVSLSENSSLSNSSNSVNSSEISTNQTATQSYVHILAGLMVRALCNKLVTHCDENSQQCIELKNITEIHSNQWCLNIAERVEKEPFSIEVMKFLDLISDPGLLSENVTVVTHSSNISIEWSLQNPQLGDLFEVTAFNISYCPLQKPNEWTCSEKWKKLTVEANNSTLKTTIENLEPDMKYRVAVVTLFKNGMQASEKKYKYIRTNSVNSNGSILKSNFHVLGAIVTSLLFIFLFW